MNRLKDAAAKIIITENTTYSFVLNFKFILTFDRSLRKPVDKLLLHKQE